MHIKFGDHVFNPKKIVLNEVDLKICNKIHEYYEIKHGKKSKKEINFTYYAYCVFIKDFLKP